MLPFRGPEIFGIMGATRVLAAFWVCGGSGR